MDHRDIRTLKLLEEIERNHSPSQRQLSRQLNISLGLVNSFIKRLAQKGYFKITNIPKNRVKYILTPKGAAEKTRLTYAYIKYSFEFYKNSRQKIRELFVELSKQGVQKIVFYGAGDLAEIAFLSLQETPIQLVAVVDDTKIGKKFLGFWIKAPEELTSLEFDCILVTDIGPSKEIEEMITGIGIVRDKITLLQ
jgi:DNA-binding MarR family transcriptional regulator